MTRTGSRLCAAAALAGLCACSWPLRQPQNRLPQPPHPNQNGKHPLVNVAN